MATLDSLPADQRAVLQLVLQRGRSYEQIGAMLRIDPSAVRRRALSALESMAPQTGLPQERQELIGDYLLDQLGEAERLQAREALAATPGERAWARVVASELAPMAGDRLPPIPVGEEHDAVPVTQRVEEPAVAAPPPPTVELDGAAAIEPDGAAAIEPDGAAAIEPDGAAAIEPEAAPVPEPEPIPAAPVATLPTAAPVPPLTTLPPIQAAAPVAEAAPAAPPAPPPGGAVRSEPPPSGEPPRRSSRRGGMVLIGLVVILAAAVVVLLLTRGSGGAGHHSPVASSKSPAARSASSTTSQTSSTAATVLGQINLTATSASSKAAGVAEVLREGSNDGVAIVADNVPPNATNPPNAYAVWLYNSPGDAYFLGFVDPGVTSTGRLSTAGPLPANASRYKDLIITVETTSRPKTPGPILLQGPMNGL